MANEHVLRLGKLIGNLHSLECLIRIFLLRAGGAESPQPYWSLKVGDVVPSDAFSNYDALERLVSKFNSEVARRGGTQAIDDGVVEIRDLIAHGRVAASGADTSLLEIVKFGKEKDGKVTVTASELMSDAWLDGKVAFVYDQVMKVGEALSTLFP